MRHTSWKKRCFSLCVLDSTMRHSPSLQQGGPAVCIKGQQAGYCVWYVNSASSPPVAMPYSTTVQTDLNLPDPPSNPVWTFFSKPRQAALFSTLDSSSSKSRYAQHRSDFDLIDSLLANFGSFLNSARACLNYTYSLNGIHTRRCIDARTVCASCSRARLLFKCPFQR